MLTEHIPLPDPARGEVRVFCYAYGSRTWWEVAQTTFSNHLELSYGHDEATARAIALELNTRMRVAKLLGA